jgi:2-oxoglutarate ferredoxin oxidoreductase subunit beta
VPILKAALKHDGFALVDVISPCVTFNDHEGSTKSYLHTRKHQLPVVQADFVPPRAEITADYPAGETHTVTMHDGSHVVLRKVGPEYDPTNRREAWNFLSERQKSGEIATGLLYVDEEAGVEMHKGAKTVAGPLIHVPFGQLCPGSSMLAELQDDYR